MHILIGLCLAAFLLWAWLIGHWFARVLVFLLLACVGFVGGAALTNISPNAPPAGIIIMGLIGAALAWPVAGLPVYYWRHRLQQLRRADEDYIKSLRWDPVNGRYINS